MMSIIYNSIGYKYDCTRRADLGIVSTLAKLLDLKPNLHYLDAACGTGNYTTALANIAGHWQGIDISEAMIEQAKCKSSKVNWQTSDISQLTFDRATFDGAICTLAIHHFPNLNQALDTLARALKSSTPLVIFTSTPEQMQGYWLCHYFPKMMHLSCKQMPDLKSVEQALYQSGFNALEMQPLFITPELKDLFLYSGKQRPEMYLSAKVRDGISSFHNFISKAELSAGLSQLKRDIHSGNITEIMRQYDNQHGDYLFIKAIKQS